MSLKIVRKLNKTDKDIPLALINSGKFAGCYVTISTNFEDDTDSDEEYNKKKNNKNITEYKSDGANLQPLLSKKGLYRLYVCGATNSGKSWLIGDILSETNMPCICFSSLDSDPSLDDKTDLIRIPLEDLNDEQNIELSEMEDKICLFDDCFDDTNKKLVKVLRSTSNTILKRGRHHNIPCIITSQLLLQGHDSKHNLINSNGVILFMQSGIKAQGITFMRQKMGMDNKRISEILEKCKNDRWMCFYRNSPNCILTPRRVIIL